MQYFIGISLFAYAVVFILKFCDQSFSKKFASLELLDWIALGFIPVYLAVLFLYLIITQKRISTKNTKFLILSLFIFSFCTVGVFAFDPQNKSAGAIIFSGMLATIGWLYSNSMTIANSRKSHTMTVLMQLRNSPEFRMHRSNVFSRFPYDLKVLPKDELPELKAERSRISNYQNTKIPIIDSMYYICNYFEFICAAVETEDLDDELIRNTMRGILIANFDFYQELINDAKKNDDGTENNLVYIHFRRLVERYRA